VHIGRDAVFDPDAIYSEAGLTPNEMIRAMEMLWTVLNRLHKERFETSFSKMGLDGFREIAQRNRATLLSRTK
jgi:hypothetical protein